MFLVLTEFYVFEIRVVELSIIINNSGIIDEFINAYMEACGFNNMESIVFSIIDLMNAIEKLNKYRGVV